jgi:type II secretory pathway pseudopilin PulG
MKKLINNQQGFSLVELMISAGLASMLIGGAMYFLGDNEKFQRLLGIKQDQTADQVLGRSIIYKDMRSSSPSFYFLSAEADTYNHADYGEKGHSSCISSSETSRPFWYTTDEVFCQGIHVELEEVGDKLEFYIVNQFNGSNSDIFSPEDFYEGDDFKEEKLEDALTDAGWSTNGFFKIQSSSPIMDEGEMKIYGAIVSGADMEDLVGSGEEYNILEKFCDITSIGTLDEFLRCLPGTGLPRVKIIPVTKVKYEIVERIKKGIELKYLERTITRVGRPEAKAGLLEGLESVRFYRGNTASPSMSFAVKFESRDNYSRKTRKP